MEIRTCSRCGFILGTRPNMKERDGVCLACLNAEKKKSIDFKARQNWLDDFLAKNKSGGKYDCVVSVSGGKDSHMIVKRLYENHNQKNLLLITARDEFSMSRAGQYNRENIAEHFDLDHLIYRCHPGEFKRQALKNFEEYLNPLRWFEPRIYKWPVEIASSMGIKIIFYGENSAFEYGETEELDIFHPASTEEIKILYMGAIYPYSIGDSAAVAREAGFKGLDDFDDWRRTGSIENDTQIDSMGYMVDIWCKFPKFGFQRVSDIACRLVREGVLTREQAELHIRDNDHILDPTAKRDFCRCVGIDDDYFQRIVDRHANFDLVRKDVNGHWRRKDFFSRDFMLRTGSGFQTRTGR